MSLAADRPLRAVGEGSENAPPPDRMERSLADTQFFTGKLWLMASGSWQVRMEVLGAKGKGEMAVPVPAADPVRTNGFARAFADALVAHRDFGGVEEVTLPRTARHRSFVAALRPLLER